MYLERINLANFKNYTSVEVQPSAGVNCLVGNNGVGKTNFLDAIYYLSLCKSHFNPIDSQNIRHGETFFAIHGHYKTDVCEIASASCIFKNGQKQMKWNGKACRTLAEHIGHIPLVMATPTDELLVTGSSEVRRKFIDGVISQNDNEYLQHLLNYAHAIEQRNSLLKGFAECGSVDNRLLDLWDEQLVKYGEPIVTQRKTFLNEFAILFRHYFSLLVDDKEVPELIYRSQLDEGSYDQLLATNRRKDCYAQHSTIGPHKDDIELQIGGHPAKRFGSQGQQKTLLLSLKLAQFQYLYSRSHIKPLLLLDDLFDKLDLSRIYRLMDLVHSDNFGQVFITDTQIGRIQTIFAQQGGDSVRIWNVDDNTIN